MCVARLRWRATVCCVGEPGIMVSLLRVLALFDLSQPHSDFCSMFLLSCYNPL